MRTDGTSSTLSPDTPSFLTSSRHSKKCQLTHSHVLRGKKEFISERVGSAVVRQQLPLEPFASHGFTLAPLLKD
jgi:hypothetical protein